MSAGPSPTAKTAGPATAKAPDPAMAKAPDPARAPARRDGAAPVPRTPAPPEPAGGGPQPPSESPLPRGDRDANPSGIGFAALVAEDFTTHGRTLLSGGFWALAVHRFGNWRMNVGPRPLRAPLSLVYKVAYHSVIALWGMDLPYNARLGRRVRFDHHGCVQIGAQRIGDDVVFRGPVTIGLLRRTDKSTSPTIGDRVEIGSGACIVGGVHIGDDSYVGPNTVVAEDVPAGAAVLGVPARRVALPPSGRGSR